MKCENKVFAISIYFALVIAIEKYSYIENGF